MGKSRTTRLPPRLCPECGTLLDAASAPKSDARPSPGDWTVCIHCAAALVFDTELKVQAPGFGALEALALTEPETAAQLRRHQAAVRQLQQKHPAKRTTAGTA
jgi:hypothetical protein